MDVGAKLEAARKACGYTREYVAKIINTSQQNIYKYEKGIVSNIPIKRIEALCSLYGISAIDVLGWDEPSETKVRFVSDLDNAAVFANNLRRLMQSKGKDRMQVCADLNLKYTTFANWYNGVKYPRIDKIEMLANYFGVAKSELIERSPEEKVSAPERDEREREIIGIFEKLSDKEKEKFVQLARLLAGE